jgi:Zn-dependent peptidase ImmA (M78 family)/DNA-binding XRE family transcriptional regulator
MSNHVLDKINPIELGAELRKAREQRGLTQQEAADLIEVARTTMTAIEKGERRIKSSELLKLARAYGRQVGDFVRTSRPQSMSFVPQFRSKAGEVPIQPEYIDELENLARNYLELERITGIPLTYHYPDEARYQFTGERIEVIAESVAAQERSRLGLGDGPIPILRNVLEQEVGLRIFYLKLKPSSYAALYIYDQVLGGCMAINPLPYPERNRWSLAHEYAHFLVHRYLPDMFGEYYQRLPERERFADAFARYFLMPTTSLMRHIGTKKIQRPDLFVLAHYYGVSVEALTRRLEDMHIIPAGIWEEMRARGVKVREVQQQLGLGPIPDQNDRLPVRYQYLAVEALERELISEGQFAQFLGVSRLTARQVMENLRSNADEEWLSELV